MINNLSNGPAAAINHSLALLRAKSLQMPVQPHVTLAPGLFLSTDPDAVITGTVASRPGEILSLNLTPQGPVRWVSLTLEMGQVDLRQCQLLGVVVRTTAPSAVTMGLTLRSKLDGGHLDTAFRKSIVAYAEPSNHIDVIDFSTDHSVPRGSAARELILMFEHAQFAVDLLNITVFAA